MTRFKLASIALSALLVMACGKVDSAEPRAMTGDAAGQAQRAPANTSAAPAPATHPGVNAQGAATLEFKKRIDAYVKIHNEAEGKVPNLKKTDDPKEISEREKALG